MSEEGETVTDEEDAEATVRERTEQLECKQQRISELATPNKRLLLAVWNDHAHHFPPEKVSYLKQLIQQSYAMTPEQTAKYFAELRADAKKAAERRKLKRKLRKRLQEKQHQSQRERAYRLFKRILKSGIRYAASTPVPPLLSVRLGYLSDIILQQLCDLRGLAVPNRANRDDMSTFLISVADWMAIAVERLYYSTQLSINEMAAHNQSQPEETTRITDKGLGPPVASSTPRSSVQGRQVPDSFDRMGPPVASSTPRSSVQARHGPTGRSPDSFSQIGPPLASSSPRASVQSKRGSQVGQPASRVTEYTTRRIQPSDRLSDDGYQTGQMQSKPSLGIENVLPYYSIVKPVDNGPTTSQLQKTLMTRTFNPRDLETTLNQIHSRRKKSTAKTHHTSAERSKNVSRDVGGSTSKEKPSSKVHADERNRYQWWL